MASSAVELPVAERPRWRVGVIDSCGLLHDAIASARFVADETRIVTREPTSDPTGHGTRLCALLTRGNPGVELVLAQVFDPAGRTSAATVAAAVDWGVEQGAHLLHLSLGLAADRQCLAAAIARATERGLLVVAAVPARGPLPFPAAYPAVLRGTGDARCQPGELSRLDELTFGGCPASGRKGGGASSGAMQVTRALTLASAPCSNVQALRVLAATANYHGRERRGIAAE
ncbi:MAG: S8 family serine peptidase [Proteobacteria bacterium]|nr:S8 family serine peptidase [Pseudomonadota bacterium]